MENKNNEKMPLSFQMAIAHNPKSMSAFLKKSDTEQDEIIKRANEITTRRQMQILVDSLGWDGKQK